MLSTTPTPCPPRPNTGSWSELPPAAAARCLEHFHVVDVRQPHEFHGDLGNIAGSELAPLATVPSMTDGWDREKPILVVCRSGKRAARASEFLAQTGFKAVFNLTGGMLAWNEGQH